MKKLIFTLLCVVLIGCSDSSKQHTQQEHQSYDMRATITDTILRSHSGIFAGVKGRLQLMCIRNVVYYYSVDVNRGFMAPAFKPDGTLYTCE
jgi:hypothetical protein